MTTALLHGMYNASHVWTPAVLEAAKVAPDAGVYVVEEVNGDRYLTVIADSEGVSSVADSFGMEDAFDAEVEQVQKWLNRRSDKEFEVDGEFWNNCPSKTETGCIFFND